MTSFHNLVLGSAKVQFHCKVLWYINKLNNAFHKIPVLHANTKAAKTEAVSTNALNTNTNLKDPNANTKAPNVNAVKGTAPSGPML